MRTPAKPAWAFTRLVSAVGRASSSAGSLLALVIASSWCLLGCEVERSECGDTTLAPLEETPQFVVLASDYTSTAVALLSSDGTVENEAFVHSGSQAIRLDVALSGDVVLPSQAVPGEVVLIDRALGALTRIRLRPSPELEQVRTVGPSSAHRPNPQDVLRLPSGALLVSRLDPNLVPEAKDLDLGNDLVVIDEAGSLIRRIDLGVYDHVEDGTRYYARPSRLARVTDGEGTIWIAVALTRADIGFSTGPGAVLFLDQAGLKGGAASAVNAPELVSLDPLENCGEITSAWPSADERTEHPHELIALCAGATFANSEGRREAAGLARLSRAESEKWTATLFQAADAPDLPSPTLGLTAIGESQVVAVAMGDSSIPDRLVLYDIERRTHLVVHRSDRAFSLGRPAFEARGARLLVPDAAAGISIFEVRAGSDQSAELPRIEYQTTWSIAPCRGLAAREVLELEAN